MSEKDTIAAVSDGIIALRTDEEGELDLGEYRSDQKFALVSFDLMDLDRGDRPCPDCEQDLFPSNIEASVRSEEQATIVTARCANCGETLASDHVS